MLDTIKTFIKTYADAIMSIIIFLLAVCIIIAFIKLVGVVLNLFI
jgi:hypothetical protein